jgi:hypothetical protein
MTYYSAVSTAHVQVCDSARRGHSATELRLGYPQNSEPARAEAHLQCHLIWNLEEHGRCISLLSI